MSGEWINHLWQSTLFACAAGLLALVFRRNRAAVRYWVWFCGSVKFLVPFSALAWVGGFVSWAPARAVPVVTDAVVQLVEPFGGVSVAAGQMESGPADWGWLALAVWACGFVAVAAARLRAWFRVRKVVRASRVMESGGPVEIRSSAALLEPGVVGWVRPVLLLPAGIEAQLSASQLAAVLAHELCHVRRRDNLTAAVHMVVEALFWFHPLVWWIGARLVEERERACDEAVLSEDTEPRQYAQAIVRVCSVYGESPLACVAGIGGADLKKRVADILARRVGCRLSLRRKAALGVAAAAVVAMPVFVGMQAGVGLAQSRAVSFGRPVGPRFEVASIRPPASGAGSFIGVRFFGGRMEIGRWSIKQLVLKAYGLETYQVSGPEWIESQRFDIQAKLPDGATAAQAASMLQWLLMERFGLKAHVETRELAGYELVVGRGGTKMKPSVLEADDPADADLTSLDALMGDGRAFGAKVSNRDGRMEVEFTKLSMGALAQVVGSFYREPVIDRTGLAGRYQVTLDYGSPNRGRGAGVAPALESSVSDSLSASVSRLGLRLERRKVSVSVLVVDSVERTPTEN